jgi:ribokinase
VDTTAAGDTFTGFFFTTLFEGAAPEKALLLATAASSIAVSRAGAAVSIPTRAEVEAKICE